MHSHGDLHQLENFACLHQSPVVPTKTHNNEQTGDTDESTLVYIQCQLDYLNLSVAFSELR